MITERDIQRHKDRLADLLLEVAEESVVTGPWSDDTIVNVYLPVPLGIIRELKEGPTRKQHVRVEQHYYLDYLADYGPASVTELAAAFDVSVSTAERKLEGLVSQGKVVVDLEHGGAQCSCIKYKVRNDT